MHAAALEDENPDIVELLLEAGADVNAKNGDSFTALMLAIYNYNIESVRLLLEAKADTNAQQVRMSDEPGGTTALMIAVSQSSEEMVNMLLEAGAEVNISRGDGWTALMAAAEAGDELNAQTLLVYGADINAKDEGGQSALQKAAQNGHVHILKLFGGTDPRLSRESGMEVAEEVSEETPEPAEQTRWQTVETHSRRPGKPTCSVCFTRYALDNMFICPSCGRHYCYECVWNLESSGVWFSKKWKCGCGGKLRLGDE